MTDPNIRTAGIDLRVARTAARVKLIDVAREMGVTPARVSQIEMLALVTDTTAVRYREALARLMPAVA